jgi:hypothetical protein
VVEVETRREHGAGAAENHRTVAELSFEAIECGMKVREKDGVLRVDLVRVHRHDGDVVHSLAGQNARHSLAGQNGWFEPRAPCGGCNFREERANALALRSPYGLGSPLEVRSYLSWMFLISALRPASGELHRLLSFNLGNVG